MKKILVCTRMPHDNSYVGGIVSIIRSYLNHLDNFEKKGYELDVFSYDPPVCLKKIPSKLSNLFYFFMQRKAIIAKLKEEKVDIVHIHTSREFLFLKDILLARSISRKFGIRIAITVHVGDIETVFSRIKLAKKITIKIINKYVSKFILLSNTIRNQFVNIGLKEYLIDVLYNFFDLEDSVYDVCCPNNSIELLFVGAIHREKGILDLLMALQDIKDNFHLTICGIITDKSIENHFWALIKNLGNKVDVKGYVTGVQKANVFRHADVLLLPSYHEGMPLVILEALGSGCAIISTKVGTTGEILDDKNVVWVEIGKSESIKNAITSLIASPNKLKEMKNSNLLLSKKFSIDEHISNLCSIYDKVFY